MLDQVLSAYGFSPDCEIIPHGSGLINRTWRIRSPKGDFILQQINSEVFTDPAMIADNIEQVASYLSTHFPDAIFPRPVLSLKGQPLVRAAGHDATTPYNDAWFRLYPFIGDSVTIDVADTPSQAYEAARKFGEFTRLLSGFPAHNLHQTLPGFHDLSRRYRDFRKALDEGSALRIRRSGQLISYLESQNIIVSEYEEIRANKEFQSRVTHHDTKISNVLFDPQGKGICVIDLDTMMPGYFISDVGDMLRTYLSPVSEEEKDLTLITVRESYFQAIVEGYMQEMRDELTATEKEAFVYAGAFMMYMQALRFLTDYLNDDIYYGRRYEDHNYVRALNQSMLLRRYNELSPRLKAITRQVAAPSSSTPR
ncbi:MAG: aminoglycoside phosphotransferase family protein [Bacteroidetes bacterium]|nr:aminoglycoside phosphotransferase family protein [Bacteroidota bacterium]